MSLPSAPDAFDDARERMVTQQLIARGISNRRVIAAMRMVPREEFVSRDWRCSAYEDRPLPIGHGQTISQPYVVARMAELVELAMPGPGSRLLEVGAGSGYAAAVFSHLAARVVALEIIPDLAEAAKRRLAVLGLGNVAVECCDGSQGSQDGPFDAIVVSAGAPRVPVLLLAQLVDGGRLVIPVGVRDQQRLVVVICRGETYETHDETPVRFVDLTGRYGWGGSGPAQA